MLQALDLNPKVLEERLRELGYTPYEAAKRFALLRSHEDADTYDAQKFYGAVRKALSNPDASAMKTIETLIAALGGKLFIQWERTEQVITGRRIVNLEGDTVSED